MSEQTFDIHLQVKKHNNSPIEILENKLYDAVLAIGYKDIDPDTGEYGGVVYGDSEMLARALIDVMERNPDFKRRFFLIYEGTP
jgi:hypothetical protein